MADNEVTRNKFNLLVGPSYYAYQTGDVVEFPSMNDIKKASYGSIEEAFIMQKINRSDFFIALGVQTLVNCNIDHLAAWLAWFKKIYPDKLIAVEEKGLKSRLEILVMEGVLRLFYCQDLNRVKLSKKSKFYSVTEKGALAIREALDGEDLGGYNSWFGIKPAHVMLRRLDATNCISAFTKSRTLYKIDCHSRNVDKNGNGSMDIYGSLTFFRTVREEGKDVQQLVKVYIEPVHFSFDPQIRSLQEIEADTKRRIESLIRKREYVLGNTKGTKYDDVKIVLIFDSKEAFSFASTYIGAEHPALVPSIILTSESLIYNGDKLADKFVCITKEGLCSPTDWIFEEE